MSTNALATLGDMPVSKYGPEDDNQSNFTKGVAFLPRVEFKGSQANIVKQKKFPVDHFALVVGKELLDLGETFSAYLLSYRYKALDFREKGKVKVSYDPKSAEFLAIAKEADKKREPGEMSGCMYGAEFLMAAKKPDGAVVLATVLCGSNSWKSVAKKMFGLTRKFVLFGSKLIEGKFTYQAPEVMTFAGSFDVEIPNLAREVQEWANASGTATEVADGADGEESVAPPSENADARVR